MGRKFAAGVEVLLMFVVSSRISFGCLYTCCLMRLLELFLMEVTRWVDSLETEFRVKVTVVLFSKEVV